MITQTTLKRWKRDALEEQFNLKARNKPNPTVHLLCNRVAQLCEELELAQLKLAALRGGTYGPSDSE